MSFRSKPPSPSGTAFSGISNYRSDSYRPVRDREIPAVPQIDGRKIARIHYDELQSFLASHIAKEVPNARSSAREKLTRLTRQQFQELSTDVYDELIRRTTNSDSPHLPTRDDFHPKRNQARQKLSTLPKARFKDLASDVFFELGRRYPEFKESEVPNTPGSTYDEFPPTPDVPSMEKSTLGGKGGLVNGRPSMETYRSRSPENNNYGRMPNVSTNRGAEPRPSLDQQSYGRRSEENNRGYGRNPSMGSRNETEGSYLNGRRPSNANENPFMRKQPEPLPPAPSTATAGVVIPNKSTIAEEEIQVPYGRDPRDSDIRDSVVTDITAEGVDDEDQRTPGVGALAALGKSGWGGKPPVNANQGGLNGFDKRADSPISDDEDSRGYFDNSTTGRGRSGSNSSNATNKKRPDMRGGMDREETEQMRKDYEYRITSLQNRVASLQDEVDLNGKAKKEDQEKMRRLTEEINAMRAKEDEQASAIKALQKELAEERRSASQKDQQKSSAQEQEIQRLRKRCDDLERDKDMMRQNGQNTDVIEDLKADMETLLEDLKEISAQNEELMSGKEADSASIATLETQLADYRQKYERARTELRNFKATSQLFLQQTKSDDQLPTSTTGAIPDTHISTFQSAADSLLTAARSNAPSSVLMPVKNVVDAVSAIVDVARSYDLRQRSSKDPPIDSETVQMACDRAEATLSNLVTASKTHATSYGLSPVSLLDAAMSHVSASVTELAKLLLIKRLKPNEREAALSPVAALNGRKYENSRPEPPAKPARGLAISPPRVNVTESFSRGGGRDDDSSSNSGSPIFDAAPPRRGIDTPISTPTDFSSATPWEELKPYLETQSDQLVQAIQGVLAAVRNPNPTPALNENVTQIITIVSSLVAVCRDSVPSASKQKGQTILDQLSAQCDRLSEVQALPSATKESRQIMAQSSFAIASAVKDLMKL